MSDRTPKYDNPPVVETVIGVQFPELAEFRSAHFGEYRSRIKDRFPACEDQPRLRSVNEVFPRAAPRDIPVVRFSRGVAPARIWYVAKPANELIQLQPDRYLFNWRKRDDGTEYPSYSVNSQKFLDLFKEFRQFCDSAQLDDPTPEIAEVTYINHIRTESAESAVELFGKVFVGMRWETADGWLPKPESAGFNRSFVIDKSRGRLHATAAVAVDLVRKEELVRLELTARVIHPAGDAVQIEESLQLAHDWVVSGFASMTSPEIQEKRWKRTT